jgi:hypothetical protein
LPPVPPPVVTALCRLEAHPLDVFPSFEAKLPVPSGAAAEALGRMLEATQARLAPLGARRPTQRARQDSVHWPRGSQRALLRAWGAGMGAKARAVDAVERCVCTTLDFFLTVGAALGDRGSGADACTDARGVVCPDVGASASQSRRRPLWPRHSRASSR